MKLEGWGLLVLVAAEGRHCVDKLSTKMEKIVQCGVACSIRHGHCY